MSMKYISDVYYSFQNQAYEKNKGYIIDEPHLFCMGFNADGYSFEIKKQNDLVIVERKGEQSYSITLTKEPTSFAISTPYGALTYSTCIKSCDIEKKANSFALTLCYSLTDSSGFTQDTTLKMRGKI